MNKENFVKRLFGTVTFDNITEARRLARDLEVSVKTYPDYGMNKLMLKELKHRIKAYEKHVKEDTDKAVWGN